MLSENSISPILNEENAEATRHVPKNSDLPLILTCFSDDAYDINSLNHSDINGKLPDFVVNESISNDNFKSIESILRMNPSHGQILFEPLSVITNLDENFQPKQQLDTPQKLNYFNNEFTDELGISVSRELPNYVDYNNLIMIATHPQQLASNGLYNVLAGGGDAVAVHQSTVVDCNKSDTVNTKENEEDLDEDLDQTEEFTYSQVEGEKGRANPFNKKAVVSFKQFKLGDTFSEF